MEYVHNFKKMGSLYFTSLAIFLIAEAITSIIQGTDCSDKTKYFIV